MKKRILVAALTISVGAFIELTNEEGFTDKAVVPVQGDRPTIGFGSTFYPDGSPVKMGDKITPQRALYVAHAHLSKDEKFFRNSLEGVELYPEEYDLYLKWMYHHGQGNWMKPKSPRTELLKGNYKAACDNMLHWRFVGKYDCSTMIDGKRNKICWGVWTRQQERHAQCMALQ